jgi:hypothetical protein
VRLTRHAKNYLRRLDGSVEDVERVIGKPIHFDRDWEGKPRYTGKIQGVSVRVVVALDEPDLVVTIHDRR